MDSVVCRKVQLISDQVNLSGDGEGANVSRNKLLAWQAHATVSGGQPNRSRLESWSSIHRMSAWIHWWRTATVSECPRPFRPLRSQQMGHVMVSQTTGTKEAGNRACTRRE